MQVATKNFFISFHAIEHWDRRLIISAQKRSPSSFIFTFRVHETLIIYRFSSSLSSHFCFFPVSSLHRNIADDDDVNQNWLKKCQNFSLTLTCLHADADECDEEDEFTFYFSLQRWRHSTHQLQYHRDHRQLQFLLKYNKFFRVVCSFREKQTTLL